MASQTTLDILLLSFGVLALLIALTLLGEFLRVRLPVGQTNPVVEAFTMRVHFWWGLTIVLSLVLISGQADVILLLAFVSFTALREFLTFIRKRQADYLS